MEKRIRHSITSTIDWQGITLSVTYEADRFGIGHLYPSPIGSLQIKAIAPARAPLPMTKTGYQSHYVYPDDIAQAGSVEAYVIAWLNDAAQSPQWRAHVQATKQLSLF